MSEGLIREVQALRAQVQRMQTNPGSKYKGAQAGDFTTTTLPQHGDYGYQTTANVLQMNANGTIREVAMTTL